MYHFATLFDQNYLSRGLCLIESLDNVLNNNYTLFILALDEGVISYFSEHSKQNITILSIGEIEEFYPELKTAKTNRSKVEYYFTLSPVLPLYILKNFKDCSRITTLDADVYFYSTPEEIFKNYGINAILITPHDFSDNQKHLVTYGKYNVSFQSFPNTANGLLVLENWKEKCIKWCGDNHDPKTGYFADQKYLDDWEHKFKDIQPIELKTCGRAPWNIYETELTFSNDKFLVGKKPLIYFHFHSLRINNNCVIHGLQIYSLDNTPSVLRKLYSKYIIALYKYNKSNNSLNDNKVVRVNTLSDNDNIFRFILKNRRGAIIFFSKNVLFFRLDIKTYLIHLFKHFKWQS